MATPGNMQDLNSAPHTHTRGTHTPCIGSTVLTTETAGKSLLPFYQKILLPFYLKIHEYQRKKMYREREREIGEKDRTLAVNEGTQTMT